MENLNGILDKEKLAWSLTKYGITVPDYQWLYEQQDGLCALCGEPEQGVTLWGGVVRMAVDHDHSCHPTGSGCRACIRGLLCRDCNQGVGKFESKPQLAKLFADYLSRRPFVDRPSAA